MTALNEEILNKDEELAVKKNKVITSKLIVILFHLPSRGINEQ